MTRTTDLRPGRRQQPSLVPAHVGEPLGVVLLGTAIIAVAALIVAMTLIVAGLTPGARFADTVPPPNVDELGRAPLLAGVAMLIAAFAEIVLVTAIVLYDWRPARPISAVLDLVVAVAAIALGLVVLTSGPAPDIVVALSLLAIGAFFMAAAVVFIVQLRRELLAGD